MKWNKFFTLFGVTGSLAISNFFQPNLGQVQAQSSSKEALIVFVNGSGDCCAGAMFKVINRVKPGNTVWTTSYANFKDKSTTIQVPRVGLSTNADALFITEATQVINSQPASRPIVLIGHSYGGDSILKVLPFITRRVELVVVIDPVGTAGFRRVATSRVVPPNVDYFMNRWQENGLTGDNIVPFDSRISGQILCQATKGCDQTAQNLVRNEDGSEKRVECGWEEVTCSGFRLGIRKGTKAKRIEHNFMPEDAYIQKIVGDKVSEVLTSFRPIASSSTSSSPSTTIGSPVLTLQGNFKGSGTSRATFFDRGNARVTIEVDGRTWFDSGNRSFIYNQTRGRCVVGNFSGSGRSDIACLYDYGNFDVAAVVFVSNGRVFEESVWWRSGVRNFNPDAVEGSLAVIQGSNGRSNIRFNYRYPENVGSITLVSTGSKFDVNVER